MLCNTKVSKNYNYTYIFHRNYIISTTLLRSTIFQHMIIAIANEKGGVGKTTSVVALGSVLSAQGYRVVLIDMDSQSDLTVALSANPGKKNIYDCLFTSKKLSAVRINPNLVLVGGSPKMTPGALVSRRPSNHQYIFREFMESKSQMADFFILDCPPNLDIATQNALAGSDYLLIPAEPHAFSVAAIDGMLNYASDFAKDFNSDLKVLGIFLTRFRKQTNLHASIREHLVALHPVRMLKTVIHENVTLQEATHVGSEIEKYGEEIKKQALVKTRFKFQGLSDYRKLCEEILLRIKNDNHE